MEFIQVSANTRTRWRRNSTRPSKLRGVELHHFAAFYKSSWRAYDWMWGRLDGSGWLVHILLDPRRILAVIENRYDWPRGQRARNSRRCCARSPACLRACPVTAWRPTSASSITPDATIPVSLPSSALFLARAWQELIAANELPAIAERMVADGLRLTPPADPAQAPDGLAESASTEPGGRESRPSGPARLASRVRAGTGPRPGTASGSPPAPADPWVTTVRALREQNKGRTIRRPAAQLPGPMADAGRGRAHPRLPADRDQSRGGGHGRADRRPGGTQSDPAHPDQRPERDPDRLSGHEGLRGNGRKTLLAGVALAIVGIVLASAGTVVIGLTGTVIALVGLYLIAIGAWGIHRGLLGALIAFTALLAVGALTLPWVRTELWGRNGSRQGRPGPARRPALAARNLVGRPGPARRHHPARRGGQRAAPGPGAAEPGHGAVRRAAGALRQAPPPRPGRAAGTRFPLLRESAGPPAATRTIRCGRTPPFVSGYADRQRQRPSSPVSDQIGLFRGASRGNCWRDDRPPGPGLARPGPRSGPYWIGQHGQGRTGQRSTGPAAGRMGLRLRTATTNSWWRPAACRWTGPKARTARPNGGPAPADW